MGVRRRLVDIVAAVGLLVIAAPLLVFGMIAVLVGSGRPIFFGHRRLGRDGRPFECWKLRTMKIDAEDQLEVHGQLRTEYRQNGFKIPTDRDPRVTRVGRVLRRTYVDELPQLVNVLGGSMSLVGPRPIVEDELDCFGEDSQELLSHTPGLFGEWTSLGRDRPPYPERARLEMEYLRNRSLARDVRILLRSIPVVLRGQGGG